MNDAPRPWFGILHVRPLPGRDGGLNGRPGAFANVLALAFDEQHYREMVAAEMATLGLFIAEFEEISAYEPQEDDSENIRRCAAQLSAEWPVQYHDFNSYPHDET